MSDDLTQQALPEPAPSAEVAQPSQEAPQGDAAGTGAAEQVADEAEQQRRASEAGRLLAEQRKRNQQNAFSRLTQRAEAAERERAELTRALLERTAPQRQEPQAQDSAPQREQFDSYEAWIEAKAEYRAEQKTKQTFVQQFQEMANQAQQQQRQREQQALAQQHYSRVESFANKNAEFAHVMENNDVRLPDFAADELMGMDDAPEILLAMHKEPQIAAVMHDMTPRQQARFLGQVSAAISLRTPQVSQAPAPGKPVAARSGSGGVGPSDGDSTSDWMRKRNAAQQAKT